MEDWRGAPKGCSEETEPCAEAREPWTSEWFVCAGGLDGRLPDVEPACEIEACWDSLAKGRSAETDARAWAMERSTSELVVWTGGLEGRRAEREPRLEMGTPGPSISSSSSSGKGLSKETLGGPVCGAGIEALWATEWTSEWLVCAGGREARRPELLARCSVEGPPASVWLVYAGG